MKKEVYKDNDYESEIDHAINQAITNLEMEGFVVTEEEKRSLKKEFLSNYNIKILVKKEQGKNGR